MPRVIVTRRWVDGDSLTVRVEVEHSYPDELSEAKRVALDAFAEAHGLLMAVDEAEDTDLDQNS